MSRFLKNTAHYITMSDYTLVFMREIKRFIAGLIHLFL